MVVIYVEYIYHERMPPARGLGRHYLSAVRAADEDVAVEGLEEDVGTAAADRALHLLLDLDVALAFLAGLPGDGAAAGGDLEIGIDLAAVRVDVHGGPEIGREGDVHVAVPGAEGHRLFLQHHRAA